MSTFLQVFLRSLETGGVYALAALGIIIIFRTSNITHFAQGSMGMFNTFVVATLVAQACRCGWPPSAACAPPSFWAVWWIS